MSIEAIVAVVKLAIAGFFLLLVLGILSFFNQRSENRELRNELQRIATQRAIDDTVVAKRSAVSPKLKEKEMVLRETIRKESSGAAEPVPDAVLDALGM